MLHLIINLVHQHIPISQFLTTLLKVRTLRNILQEHGMDVKCIIGTVERDDAPKMIVGTTFLNGIGKGLGGAAFAFFEVVFLTP